MKNRRTLTEPEVEWLKGLLAHPSLSIAVSDVPVVFGLLAEVLGLVATATSKEDDEDAEKS